LPFLAPLLLGGLVFASAPIIIHLLNRRRFKLVEWAPMRYLKLTLRTNRRRLQLEQWILLAIRTLVILLLIFAAARFYLTGNAAAAWLSLGGRTSRVILIDDSLSMGLKTAGQSALDRATDQAGQLIETLGTQDALTVATTSTLTAPMRRDSVMSSDEAAALAKQVRDLTPTESANNWAATLASLGDLLEGAAHSNKEVRLFTDRRAVGWSAEAAEQANRLVSLGVRLVIVDVGQGSEGNASLASFDQSAGVALVNTPIHFVAKIDTDGDPQFKADYATLVVDGAETTVKLPDIAAGQRGIELKASHTFDTPGQHTVELRLPDDTMPGDNARSLVVEVAESVRVLLVDGEPGIAPRDSEVFFLAQVFYSGSTPIRTTVTTDAEWLQQPSVGNYDLVVLANVEKLPAERIDQLRAMVEAGCGLMIFTGDQVDPSAYNTLMYEGGRGLMPAAIELGETIEVQGLVVEPIDHSPIPVLTQVQAERPSLLARVAPWKVSRAMLPDLTDRSDTRVLARWNSPGLPPAAIEKRLGKGRVILWTVTADRGWSDWPTEGTYLIGMRESALSIAGVSTAAGNLTAGWPIIQRVSPSNPPSRAEVVRPGSDTALAATIDREEPSRPVIRYADTRHAGLYKLTWDVPGQDEPRKQSFAVSPDARESELRRLSEDELKQMLPNVDLTLIDPAQAGTGGAQRELWRTLAMMLLGFVIFESAFAAWVGREH